MQKYALSTMLTGFVAAGTLFCGGCGDDGSILIDDQRQEQSSGKKSQAAQPKEEAPAKKEAGQPKESVLGQLKGIFKGEEDDGAAPAAKSSGKGVRAKKVQANAKDDANVDPADAKRWTDADEQLNDPDFEYAVKCAKEQNYSEAKHQLLNITARHPDSSSAWRWLGDCHYNLLELQDAINAYQKALKIHAENYFALRGEAFAHLHLGHEYWRAGTPEKRALAHDQYKQAMKNLQDCLNIYPGDLEAMYGLSMAAEGASRRLYQNAIAQLRANNREVAESDARNCLEIVKVGVDAARQRMFKNPQEVGPRSIAGGLLQRQAMLHYSFRQMDDALESISQACKAYQSILEISPNNYLAKQELDRCQKLQAQWEKEKGSAPAGR